jgi:hypothetical protein
MQRTALDHRPVSEQLVDEFEDEFERTAQDWRIRSRQARFTCNYVPGKSTHANS